jgi:hypothetical protein
MGSIYSQDRSVIIWLSPVSKEDSSNDAIKLFELVGNCIEFDRYTEDLILAIDTSSKIKTGPTGSPPHAWKNASSIAWKRRSFDLTSDEYESGKRCLLPSTLMYTVGPE